MDKKEFQKSCRHVADGAQWLDNVKPGWERKIDTSLLDIEDPIQCVCGQALTHGWSDDLLYGKEAWWLIEHGFLEQRDGDQWIALIKERFD